MKQEIDTRIAYIFNNGNERGKRISIVQFEKSGYYPTDLDDPTMSNGDVRRVVHDLNEHIGVPDEVAESMHMASMFGWHVPAAHKASDFWLLRVDEGRAQ